jgi:hypothetical protein
MYNDKITIWLSVSLTENVFGFAHVNTLMDTVGPWNGPRQPPFVKF